MGKYRELGTGLDRVFRNNLNDNFDDIGVDVDDLQAQVNTLVVSGDSSVEAAQARVEADGTTNATLKERLDKKETEFESQLAEKASKDRLKDISINVRDYGALGDWNGTSGTNNLTSFNAAVNALPSTGGTIYVPEGDYWFSDAWIISKDNVTVFISPNAILRTTTQTPFGGLLTFKGLGTGTAPTMKNGRVTGGGQIITPASLDNAIGFVRCDGCYVDSMVLTSGHKGITTQEYNKNIIIERNKILSAGTAGVAIESGATNVKVSKNEILSTAKGILFSSSNGARANNVIISENSVSSATSDGILVSLSDDVIVTNNICTNVGGRGITVDNSSNISIHHNTLKNVTQHGINLAVITKTFSVIGNILDGVSVSTSNTWNGIMLDTVIISFSVMNNVILGATHKWAVNIGSSSGNNGVFVGNVFTKGASDGATYAGWAPKRVVDVFGGVAYNV